MNGLRLILSGAGLWEIDFLSEVSRMCITFPQELYNKLYANMNIMYSIRKVDTCFWKTIH